MDHGHNNTFNEKIEPEWFLWVIHKQGSSVRKLGADKDIGRCDKTIELAIKAGSIRAELLDRIAKKLDVYPDYLAGRYAWTLKLDIMNEDGVREYWRYTFLDPKHFPYRLAEQFRLGSYQHLMNTLMMHDVSESEYKSLDWDQRHELESYLDRYTTRILHHWFPEHAKPMESLDYFEAMEWKDERDVIEAMLDYLEERGLVKGSFPEPDPDWVDPFAEEYRDMPLAE